MSLRAKRSNLIVSHTAITDKKYLLFALVPALCVGMHTKRALIVTAPVAGTWLFSFSLHPGFPEYWAISIWKPWTMNPWTVTNIILIWSFTLGEVFNLLPDFWRPVNTPTEFYQPMRFISCFPCFCVVTHIRMFRAFPAQTSAKRGNDGGCVVRTGCAYV